MSVHRAEGPIRDPFATAPGEASAGRSDAPKPRRPPIGQRHLLPKDLPGSLRWLDDGEIDTLLAAVTDEAKRRGILPLPTSMEKPAEQDRGAESTGRAKARPRAASQRRSAGEDGVATLALGRANAVRAAFMAGVKPSMIARQFGISQSVVRQVLAGGTPARKP